MYYVSISKYIVSFFFQIHIFLFVYILTLNYTVMNYSNENTVSVSMDLVLFIEFTPYSVLIWLVGVLSVRMVFVFVFMWLLLLLFSLGDTIVIVRYFSYENM